MRQLVAQTLKHVYEDLRHHDVRCVNEAEFRAYDVLLKLNDGDTLQSVETLPHWVRRGQCYKNTSFRSNSFKNKFI
jgi:hypothetical protein